MMLNSLMLPMMSMLVSAIQYLEDIGKMTHIVKFPFIDNVLIPLSTKLKLQLPMIKYSVGLFLSYPFAACLRFIPRQYIWVKHLFSFLIGLIYVQWIYDYEWIHSILAILSTYFLCLFLPKKYIGQIIFLWAMSYVLICQIYCMYIYYQTGRFDFTRTQMVITMKLTSFAYSLADGYELSQQKENKNKHDSDINDTTTNNDYNDKNSVNNDNNSNNNNSNNNGNNKNVKILADRQRYAISQLPSLLIYLGYMYCFPTILVGPSLEFNEYIYTLTHNSIWGSSGSTTTSSISNSDNSDGYSNSSNGNIVCDGDVCVINYNKTADKNRDGQDRSDENNTGNTDIPYSSFWSCIQPLTTGLICLYLHLLITPKYPIKIIGDHTYIISHTWYTRFIHTYIALFGERCKYYFVWKVAEGGCIIGGFGYDYYYNYNLENTSNSTSNNNLKITSSTKATNISTTSTSTATTESISTADTSKVNHNQKVTWSGAINIDILTFELATNTQTITRSWNKKTQRWLERYTYLRTNKSLFCTYLVSALWHGLYPGFFIFFLSMPLLTEIERLIRQKINPYILLDNSIMSADTKKTYFKTVIIPYLYNSISWIGTSLSITYVAHVFHLQTWDRCYRSLLGYYFIPHIIFVLIYLVLRILPRPNTTHMKQKLI